MKAAGFDGIAPLYPSMESWLAGNKLQKARLEHLHAVPMPNRVLLVGEGHGKFLSECRIVWPEADITVIEASFRMIVEARKRLRQFAIPEQGIHWVHSSVHDWLRPSKRWAEFDLVVTHFFLDCFDGRELECCVKGLSRCMCGGSSWLVADFQIPQEGPHLWLAGIRARWIHAGMYAFFRKVTRLPARRWEDPSGWLESEGFRLKHRKTREWGLIRSDWWKRGD